MFGLLQTSNLTRMSTPFCSYNRKMLQIAPLLPIAKGLCQTVPEMPDDVVLSLMRASSRSPP